MINTLHAFITLKKVSKKLVAGLVLLGLMSPLHIKAEATASNYAEMALALATIPFNIAGHHCAVKNSPKKAAFFHLIADSASLCNRALFFCNNNGEGHDSIAVGFLAGFDALSLGRNLVTALANAQNTANPTVTKNAAALLEIHNKIQTAYPWAKVIIPPILKGVTALALAYTQDGVSRFSSQQARCLAVSANSLTCLLDKYVLIEEDNFEKKVLFTLLILNTWWLCYEAIQYATPADKGKDNDKKDAEPNKDEGQEDVDSDDEEKEVLDQDNKEEENLGQLANIEHKMQHRIGECELCTDESADLYVTHCNHGYCKDCWQGHINKRFWDDRMTFDQIPCPVCTQPLLRDEIQELGDNNIDYLKAYDIARINKNKAPVIDKNDKAFLQYLKEKTIICPNPMCKHNIEKNGGCNHMTCKYCGRQFCNLCRTLYELPNAEHGYHKKSCKCKKTNELEKK